MNKGTMAQSGAAEDAVPQAGAAYNRQDEAPPGYPSDDDDSPVSPGEVIWKEFMEPEGMTQAKLARRTGLKTQDIHDILRGGRKITPRTAIALGDCFGVSPMVFLNLQSLYDLQQERHRAAAVETGAKARELKPAAVGTEERLVIDVCWRKDTIQL